MRTATTPPPRIAVWFIATSTIFFARAFLFSTWVSRGPEVKDLLDINTMQMGLFTMLYPIGGLLGISFASTLVQRFGSRVVTFGTYALATASLALLGPAIEHRQIAIACFLLMLMGLPMAIADFVGNYEGTLADAASRHSIFPAMHGAYGVGMLSAAALAGLLSGAAVGLTTGYLIVAVFIAAAASATALALPRHAHAVATKATRTREHRQVLAVWRERRSLMIALIGFSFIMAEMAAGTWVPIALTNTGFTGAQAAFAFSIFWIVVTVVRLSGGFVVDAIGRFRTILLSAIVTSAGIAVFMLAGVVALPYLGLVLWGAGFALGFPMSVSAMGDDPAMAAARINMIITVVYLASITVGPALGTVGQAFGIFTAFAIPLVLLVIAAVLSPVTKPLRPMPHT
mgnify:CR=1 FL=1